MDKRQLKVHFQYALLWANCSRCHRGVFDFKDIKNSLHQYAVWAKDDGENWYAGVFSSCLQADGMLFQFCSCSFVVAQQIQNFEVKTETISQSSELRHLLIYFLHLFVLWGSTKAIYTSLIFNSFICFGPWF